MVIGKFIGAVLIIVSLATLIGLIISLFTAGTADFMGVDYFFDGEIQMINPTNVPIWVISLLILILVGIPFLMLFFLGLFILSSKSKILSRTAKFVLLGCWIIALLAAIYIGVRQGAEFSREGTSIEREELTIIPSDTLSIKMVDDETISNYTHFRRRSNFKKVLGENDKTSFYSNDIRVSFKMADSSESYIKIKKEAYGRTRIIAKENANKISYNISKIGNTLSLDGYFLVDTQTAFKNQEVRLTIYIPKNQVLYFDETTRTFLNYNIETTREMYRDDMTSHYFKMTDNGLECLDCVESDYIEQKKEEVDIDTNEESVNTEIDNKEKKVEIQQEVEEVEQTK